MIEKLPLQNIEIEQGCLSSAIISRQALLELMSKVEVDDFYLEKHRIIFQCLQEMYNNKINIDLLSLKTSLIRKGLYESIGSEKTLTEIYEGSSSSAGINNYINQLLDYSKRRQTQNISQQIIEESTDLNSDISDIISNFEGELRLIDRERGGNIDSLNTILGNDLQNLQVKEGEYMDTGFLQLDKKLMGFFNELIIIAARPSMGKTALALNIMRQIAIKKRVDLFSLEQPAGDIALRLICAETNIEFYKLKKPGEIDLYMLEKVKEAYQKLRQLNICVSDRILKASKIINTVERQREKPDLIITDYLQLIPPEDRKLQRHLQIQEITRMFKNFAKDSGIPHILICQLNRTLETRKDKRPMLSDLRESGDIEQDADKIIFIYREDINAEKTEFIIAKNRNGRTGIEDAFYDRESMKFI